MSDTCMHHIENHWKKLTFYSNELFNNSKFERALHGYEEALYRSEVLNNHIELCNKLKIPFVQIYIISCNNLANTYKEINKKDKAEKILKRALFYLLHLTGNKSLDKENIKMEMRKAMISYTYFIKENNIPISNKEKLFQTIKEEILEKSA
ncbi:tetratricopeptide repeat protein [Apibacter raozihei]|uniref:tetratricopeptide repeat protein n=1 Tax=Apibacter TaxID=1778601 RepID=UPI000FE40E75|nr:MULTISPECIES: tetratricopeptide repeat protein [Apibacter]